MSGRAIKVSTSMLPWIMQTRHALLTLIPACKSNWYRDILTANLPPVLGTMRHRPSNCSVDIFQTPQQHRQPQSNHDAVTPNLPTSSALCPRWSDMSRASRACLDHWPLTYGLRRRRLATERPTSNVDCQSLCYNQICHLRSTRKGQQEYARICTICTTCTPRMYFALPPCHPIFGIELSGGWCIWFC